MNTRLPRLLPPLLTVLLLSACGGGGSDGPAAPPAAPAGPPAAPAVPPDAPAGGQSWVGTGGMAVARSGHTATRLSDGRVLVAGGIAPDGTAQAAPGGLDPTFGSGGLVTTDFFGGSDGAADVVLQPDGKIVAAGSSSVGFALARYNPDGSLDTTFGSGGKVTTDFTFAYALALQPDGKIVAAGSTYTTSSPDFALARYNSDGSLDTSFGSGGKVTTDFFGSGDSAYALALQPDGKIVAAGYAWTSTFYDFALVRYNSDGSLDTGFGSGGTVVADFSGYGSSGHDSVYALALQSDGKIVAAGSTQTFFYDEFGVPIDAITNFALARYNSDGSLDTSFGSGGKVTTGFFCCASARALALQPDGKIVAAGAAGGFALFRYNSDGSLDTSFGSGGTVVADFSSSAYAVALQSDGKIVVAGYAVTYPIFDLALARYNPDGSLDTSFGSGGKVTTDIFGGDDSAYALALQPDGKIVAAGYGFNPYVGYSDFALARYLGGSLTLSSMSLNPTSVTAGATSTGTVTLSAAAPAGGAAVALSSSNPSVAAVPASVTVPAGATSATFTVSTNAVTASITVTISGTYSGTTRSAELSVNPVSLPDTEPPDTSITSAVDGNGASVPNGGTTRSATITFSFAGSDNAGVAGFECSLDGAAFAACASPKTYGRIARGTHTFRVRAVDSNGLRDQSPAAFTWRRR